MNTGIFVSFIQKTLPINEEKQLRAKFLFGLLINMINIPILLVITACTIGFNFGLYIGLILGGMVGYIFALTSGLLIDVINPKLEWTEPINAVKKNPNLFISMIICYAVIFLYGYTLYKLVILKEINNPYFNPNEMFDIVSNIGIFTYVALAIFTILSIIMYVVSVRIYKNKLKTY